MTSFKVGPNNPEISKALEDENSKTISVLKKKIEEEESASSKLAEKNKWMSEELKNLNIKLDEMCIENKEFVEKLARIASQIIARDNENDKLENELRAAESLLRDRDEGISKLTEQVLLNEMDTELRIENKDIIIQELRKRIETLEERIGGKEASAEVTKQSSSYEGFKEDRKDSIRVKTNEGIFEQKRGGQARTQQGSQRRYTNGEKSIRSRVEGKDDINGKKNGVEGFEGSGSQESEGEDMVLQYPMNKNNIPILTLTQRIKISDKSCQTIDLEMSQMRRNSSIGGANLALRKIVGYIELSSQFKTGGNSFGNHETIDPVSPIQHNGTPENSRSLERDKNVNTPPHAEEELKLEEKMTIRLSLKEMKPTIVNHEIETPDTASVDRVTVDGDYYDPSEEPSSKIPRLANLDGRNNSHYDMNDQSISLTNIIVPPNSIEDLQDYHIEYSEMQRLIFKKRTPSPFRKKIGSNLSALPQVFYEQGSVESKKWREELPKRIEKQDEEIESVLKGINQISVVPKYKNISEERGDDNGLCLQSTKFEKVKEYMNQTYGINSIDSSQSKMISYSDGCFLPSTQKVPPLDLPKISQSGITSPIHKISRFNERDLPKESGRGIMLDSIGNSSSPRRNFISSGLSNNNELLAESSGEMIAKKKQNEPPFMKHRSNKVSESSVLMSPSWKY